MATSSLRRVVRFGIALIVGALAGEAAALPAPNPRWEPEIAAIEQRTQGKPAAQGDGVLFVGSSSIRLWKTLERDFPDHAVLNHGFGGSRLIDSVAYADRIVFPFKPKTIVIYAGTNDIAGGVSPETVFEHFKLFVETVRARLPKTRILFISIAPNPRRWELREKFVEANRLVADYIRRGENMDYVDVYDAMLGEDGLPLPDIFVADRLHMNPKGYEIWTKILGSRL